MVPDVGIALSLLHVQVVPTLPARFVLWFLHFFLQLLPNSSNSAHPHTPVLITASLKFICNNSLDYKVHCPKLLLSSDVSFKRIRDKIIKYILKIRLISNALLIALNARK